MYLLIFIAVTSVLSFIFYRRNNCKGIQDVVICIILSVAFEIAFVTAIELLYQLYKVSPL